MSLSSDCGNLKYSFVDFFVFTPYNIIEANAKIRDSEETTDNQGEIKLLGGLFMARSQKKAVKTGSAESPGQSGTNALRLSPELTEKVNALLQTNPQAEGAIGAFVELLCEKSSLGKKPPPQEHRPKADRPGWIPVLGRSAAGILHFWEQSTVPCPKDAIVELDQLVEKYTGRAVTSSRNATVTLDLNVEPLQRELKGQSVALIQVSGGMGDGQTSQIAQFVDCEQIYKMFPDAFGLQIDGDSMSPRINDTDIVILSPSVPAAQGHIAVAKLQDQIGITCKLIRTTESNVHFIPINEKYEAKIVPHSKLLWALAVLCHIRI